MPTSRARAFVEILARKLDPNPDELPKFSHIPHSDADSVLSPAASSSISILEGDPGKGVHFTPTPSNVSPGNFLGLGKGTVDSPIHFTPTPSNESTADFPVSFTPSLSPGHTRIEIDIKTAREMAWQFGEMNIPYNLRDAIYTYRASTCRAGDISLAALWKRVSISSDNTLLIWYDRMEFSRKVEEEVNRLQRKGDVLTRKTAQELRELLDCKVSDWALVLRQARWYGAFWLDLVGLSEPYLDCPGVGICALVLARQAVQTDKSDEDSENGLTGGDVPFQVAPGAPTPKRSIAIKTPKRKTDTIVVAAEGEDFSVRLPRRTRKPSAKAKQNEEGQNVFETGRLDGKVGVGEHAAPENIQEQLNKQTDMLKTLLKEWMKQDAHNKKIEAKLAHMEKELEAVKGECQAVKEELLKTKEQMADGIAALISGNSSPNPSYAEVVRTPPTSQSSNVQTLSSFNTTPSNFTNTFYCTIDTSRVEAEASDQVSAGAIRTMVENRMRNERDNATWRCRAVTMDPKNPHRIRIACRDEAEHKTVKQAVEANLIRGARILRDDLYPIRVDSVNRTAVLDETGNIRTGAIEALSEENDTQVAKIAWLSNRSVPKAYGSMVVYLTKVSDARRFLQEGFFYAGGNRDTPKLLNAETAQTDATTARKSRATKPSNALKRKSVGDVQKKAITKRNARKPS
ncbi:hypothetical protein B0O99DRAFT_695540 [Bisporella sp. PMI_857]|nr:hypothetical protein B0O99DRAFT_695540 [Bisporella sp. PMI_857]